MVKDIKRTVKRKSSAIKPSKNNKPQSIGALPIVAIGASAGGLEAFERFFKHVTPSGIAYIIITHLDRDHISILPQLIEKCTPMPVVTIKSGIAVKPDTIYVIPPKTNIVIKNDILTFTKQVEPHYKNLPISLFLQSLALDRRENAIAVILSGSGEDGTTGLRDINEYGGLIIAQNPATAAYDSMPRSAINTGLVDYVMNAEDMFLQLKKYLNHGKVVEGKRSPELQQILSILRTHTGHDFTHYKLNTVLRRIEKQMYGHHINTLSEYVSVLRKDKNEIDNLLGDLLIGVTRFFRDKDAFNFIKNDIFPELLKKLPKNYCIRIWVPACSTGEEAYSIAILLRECMDEIGKNFNLQIFATDIDLNALNIARSGTYPESISHDVSEERLKRFFTKELDHYKVKSDIRTKIIFGEQNIIKDPPFTKLDFISCRNLLIYLDANLQKKVLPLLHYSLKPNGTLFLGISESTSGFTDYFELIGKKYKVFRRRHAASSPRAMLGFDVMPRSHDIPFTPDVETERKNDTSTITHQIDSFILDNFTSPCVVINKNNDIIYMHGSTKNYLKISGKKTDSNLSRDTHNDIKLALLPLIHRVRLKKTKLIYRNLQVKVAKKIHDINLHVIPISHISALRSHILIIFEDNAKEDKNLATKNKSSLKKNNIKLEILIQELQNTKENLQATIEELEAGNEELQSSNEELQSTNEEIETSKEELQSLNEELIIVNSELQSMIDQLATVNDDMNNLFNSTEIAAFFLDNELRIKRFTPKAQEFMHLIKTDVGRSFSHFTTSLKSGKIVENAESVLKTLVQKSYDVESKDGNWYNIRILPYRTLTNMIDGVVITLTDVTVSKEREIQLLKLNQALKNTLRYTENIINIADIPVLVLNTEYCIMTANRNFFEVFKVNSANVVDKPFYDIKDSIFDIEQLRKSLASLIIKNKPIQGLPIEFNNVKLEHKAYSVNAHMIPYLELGENLIFLSLEPSK